MSISKDLLEEFNDYKDAIGDLCTNRLDDECLICECFCVNVADLRSRLQDIKELNEATIALLSREYGLGNGCGSCLKNKEMWKDRIF